jgi:hypothetical protein
MTGDAWHFELPEDCQLRTSLNALEFIACTITIWVDSLREKILPEDCIQSQTDSSATGWLRKSNFCDHDDEVVQLLMARKLANIIMSTESCLYSQWFEGNENCVADSLSCDFHIPDFHLQHLLCSTFPLQVPFGFKILPLPTEIVSWLMSLLLKQL